MKKLEMAMKRDVIRNWFIESIKPAKRDRHSSTANAKPKWEMPGEQEHRRTDFYHPSAGDAIRDILGSLAGLEHDEQQ
jgi:hypothetical protein